MCFDIQLYSFLFHVILRNDFVNRTKNQIFKLMCVTGIREIQRSFKEPDD